MSRVLYVALKEPEVIARCGAEHVGISTLETLPCGGMRLVCKSTDGAALMGRKLKTHLMKGEPVREARRPRSSLW